MATHFRKLGMLQFILVVYLHFSGFGFLGVVESLGINYGQLGNNLPTPHKVIDLLQTLKITKARIYDTNPEILMAFANSPVELIVTIENNMLSVLTDPQQALQWVSTHIQPYFPATKIRGIAVGNECFTGGDTAQMIELVQAMVAIHGALVQLGLDQYIHVSTPSSLAILQESFPPSAGVFKPELTVFMTQFLQFLSNTKSPFWINSYPFFAYKDNPSEIPLDYALFNPNVGMIDPYTTLHYDNMLYAQVDAIIFAMAKLGFQGIEVRVSETGWPSKGDTDEIGATTENAAMYNKNLLRRQLRNEGTPLRPNMRLDVYLFALFNENMKPGPISERNYGLYHPDLTTVYNVGLVTSFSTTSSTSTTPVFLNTSSAQRDQKKGCQNLMHLFLLYVVVLDLFLMRRLF